MKVKLTIYNGEKEYFSRAISTPCVIGRGKQSDVAILHPLISRQHCEIYDENGKIFVRDLGSLNGTFFDGARIGRGAHISFGSSFKIGSLSFQIDRNDVDAESAVVSVSPVPSGESRDELRRRAFDALDDFEKLDSEELGLAPEREESVEEEELGLTPEFDARATPSKSALKTPEPEKRESEEVAPVDSDDVIDLEKFLKGEL